MLLAWRYNIVWSRIETFLNLNPRDMLNWLNTTFQQIIMKIMKAFILLLTALIGLVEFIISLYVLSQESLFYVLECQLPLSIPLLLVYCYCTLYVV